MTAISRGLWAAATVSGTLQLAACGDLTLPTEETLPSSDLLILRLQSAAPAPASASFVVSNDRATVRRILHDDGFNTPFVELEFPVGSLDPAPDDSITVTVTPLSGRYGITIGPPGVELGSGVTVRFFFGVYADDATLEGSTRYASWAAFVGALAVWEEVTPGMWRRVSGSQLTPSDEALAPLSNTGTLVVAARR